MVTPRERNALLASRLRAHAEGRPATIAADLREAAALIDPPSVIYTPIDQLAADLMHTLKVEHGLLVDGATSRALATLAHSCARGDITGADALAAILRGGRGDVR